MILRLCKYCHKLEHPQGCPNYIPPKSTHYCSICDEGIYNGEEYIVKDIIAEDEELKAFLFSLGCYSGEPITVISHIRGGCVVSVKDARYTIDTDLAKAISI